MIVSLYGFGYGFGLVHSLPIVKYSIYCDLLFYFQNASWATFNLRNMLLFLNQRIWVCNTELELILFLDKKTK